MGGSRFSFLGLAAILALTTVVGCTGLISPTSANYGIATIGGAGYSTMPMPGLSGTHRF
jgi:hypothetical protein